MMSIWGIGPFLVISGVVTFSVTVAAGLYLGNFGYDIIGRGPAVAAGIILLAAGLVFWGNSVYLVTTRFRSGRLIREGVFRVVRNPMYAAFILFIVPGVSLIIDNWLVLLTSPVLFAVFRLLIPREETFLEETFGDEYRRYKREVKQIIPFIM